MRRWGMAWIMAILFLFLAGCQEKLPEQEADLEQIKEAELLFPMEYAENGDVILFADLDQDGKKECIETGLTEYRKDERGIVEVHDGEQKDSPVIWDCEYSRVHAGNLILALYREDEKDYLVKYTPYIGQGHGEYRLEIFSLNSQGEENIFRSYEMDFQLYQNQEDGIESGFFGDRDQIRRFLEKADDYMENSLLIVSTDNGKLSYSTPEKPITYIHDFESSFGVLQKH